VEKLIYRKFYKQCLIALTGIAFMVSSMQGIILCVAEDGHVAIEFASSVCCDSLDASISPEGSTASHKDIFLSSKENCGPCVDMPISVLLTNISKKLHPVDPTTVVLTTIVTAIIPSEDISGYQLGTELFASVNPCLASLRTIILLI